MAFSIGEVVMKNQPFAHILEFSERSTHCDWCFKTSKLKKCAKCKLVYYCQSSCQTKVSRENMFLLNWIYFFKICFRLGKTIMEKSASI